MTSEEYYETQDRLHTLSEIFRNLNNSGVIQASTFAQLSAMITYLTQKLSKEYH